MDMDYSMGGSAGIAIKPDPYLAQVYWTFVGSFIAVAGLVNLKEFVEYKLRFVLSEEEEGGVGLIWTAECALR